MRINFRSKLFDATTEKPEGAFLGEDVARWLSGQLSGWDTSVVEEDWGWAILAKKDAFDYIIGVYDHDTVEVTMDGPVWVIRLFNRKDRSQWLLKLFRYIPPVAHQEVLDEIVGILKRTPGIVGVSTEAL